jgi:Secretion system C-terminal sorting domain
MNGVNYYRLRMDERDGQFKYSKIHATQINGQNKDFKTYPSLVSDGILNLITVGQEYQAYDIFNTLGQQVMHGKTAQTIDVSVLPQGTYVIKLREEQAKFIK